MKPEIILRKKALTDIYEAINWYEEQKAGLGTEFFEEVQSSLKKIENNPKQFIKTDYNIRVAQTKRFPFLIYFIIQKLKILIIAVLHASRDNSKRIDKENDRT